MSVNSESSFKDFIAGYILGIIFGACLLGFGIAKTMKVTYLEEGKNIIRKEAVVNKVATYTTNEEGEPVFTWSK